MNQPNQFLIEGVDRLGKSTLIQNILDELGYYRVIHTATPKKLRAYRDLGDPLFRYQWEVYNEMFKMIDSTHNKIVFDRAHLGEMVYSPIYRKYGGDYVLELEQQTDTSKARLVLLVTSDFSFIEDDGLSLDFNKKEREQDLFVKAFAKSRIEDKLIVDVCDGRGGYKKAESILAEVLKK